VETPLRMVRLAGMVIAVIATLVLALSCELDPVDTSTHGIFILPSRVAVKPGTSLTFTAYGMTNTGDTVEVDVNWSIVESDSGTPGSKGNGKKTGFKPKTNGKWKVIAEDPGGGTDTSDVAVGDPVELKELIFRQVASSVDTGTAWFEVFGKPNDRLACVEVTLIRRVDTQSLSWGACPDTVTLAEGKLLIDPETGEALDPTQLVDWLQFDVAPPAPTQGFVQARALADPARAPGRESRGSDSRIPPLLRRIVDVESP
jgi:hypothetical protein